MDTVLGGVEGVTCYIDDILVSSPDDETHMQHLQKVFNRLEKHRPRKMAAENHLSCMDEQRFSRYS